MPASSYNDYATVLLSLPGTGREVSQRCGMTARGTHLLLRRMWALNLVHPHGTKQTRGTPAAVWHLGQGAGDLQACPDGPLKPRAGHIAFAYVWRELEEGATAHQLAALTGVSRVSVYALLHLLRQHKKVRVAGWGRDAEGRPVAVWVHGTGRDAPRPAPKTKAQKGREYRENLRIRSLMGLARPAAANEPERQAA